MKLSLPKFLLGFMVFVTMIASSTWVASALGQDFFDDSGANCDVLKADPSQGDQCGNRQVRLEATQTNHVNRGPTRARAYFKGITTNPSGVPVVSGLKLTIKGGQFCPGGTAANSIDQRYDGYYATHKPATGQQVTNFNIISAANNGSTNGPRIAVAGTGQYRQGDDYCLPSGGKYATTITITATMLHKVDPVHNRYPGVYYVELYAQPGSVAPTGFDGIDNGFNLTEDGTSGTHASVISSAQVTGDDLNHYNFTFREGEPVGSYRSATSGPSQWTVAQSSARGYNNSYATRFGADCSVADATDGKVNTQLLLYDADYNNSPDSGQLRTLLVKTDIHGDMFRLSNNPADPNYYSNNQNGTNGKWIPYDGVPSLRRGRPVPTNGNNNAIYVNFEADAGDKFQLYIMDVRPDLINQIGIPFDGFYYTAQSCLPPPPDGSPSTVTANCGITANVVGTYVEPGQVYTATFNGSISDTMANSTVAGITFSSPQFNAGIPFAGQPPGGGLPIASANTVSLTAPSTTGSVSLTATMSYTVFENGVSIGTRTATCSPAQIIVAQLPYLKVFGGDVEAGYGPVATGGTCQAGADAGRISSWNKGTTGSFSGAGTQYGAQALGVIKGFVSGQQPLQPRGYDFSFANTDNANHADDTYGGEFGDSEPCVDYSIGLTASPTYSPPASQVSGHVPPVYIKSDDVFIGNDIKYVTNYAYGAVPSYKLVVVGHDIYIGNTVAQLDGLYVAQPDALGNGGHIYTCASAKTVPFTSTTDTNYFSDCNHKLVVNGSFIAKQVYFLRTSGELKDATSDSASTQSSNAAETFYYSPEEWLGQQGSGTPTPAAITSLPPTL